MKVWQSFLFVLFLLSDVLFAQSVSTRQSDSTIDWLEYETEEVQLIFPEGRLPEAKKIASFIKSYSSVVGKDYGIDKPNSFPLILRPGLAVPNGFVTLGPRRSEWFAHETFSPFIGGLNFYQALAIHEYRHIIQFDYNYRSNNRFGYYLFGELGWGVLSVLGLPNWFFEGDAVYAETYYTDAGRGRSPRFLARLKALVLSDQIPPYDEFIGGSYKTFLPNHYTYGYALVTRAKRLFGNDFWAKVVHDVATFSLSPYRIYGAIERKSGVPFEKFYYDTFAELKEKWQKNGDQLKASAQEYERQLFPFFSGQNEYLLKRGLNNFWGLYEKEASLPVAEFPISPSLSKIDLRGDKLAYTQFLPDTRYQFKGFSDLFVYDLKSGETHKLTSGKRLFHPNISASSEMIVATEKNEEGKWAVSVFDQSGLRKRSIKLAGLIPVEAVWKDEDSLFILAQDELGYKKLILLKIGSGKRTTLFAGTRNNIFALRYNGKFLSFEGDWQGRVQSFIISNFKKDASSLKVCSSVPIAAFTPVVHDERIYYTSEMSQGQRLESQMLDSCRSIALNDFLGSERLSKDSPSDAYVPKNGAGAVELARNFDEANKGSVKESNVFFSGLQPHSWSFLGGNGYQVGLQGNNLLGSFGYDMAVGRNSSESRPFANLSLSYAGYYPIIGASVSYRERNTETFSNGPDEQWTEFESVASVSLPFTLVSGFYTHNIQATALGGFVNIGERTGSSIYEVSDEELTLYGGVVGWSFQKAKTFQQIIPKFGLRALASYRKAESDRRSSFGTEQIYGEFSFFLPAFAENDGFKFQLKREKQTSGVLNYRHSAFDDNPGEYVFSRGFSYGYVDQYTKGTIDYVVPLLSPNWNLLDFHYLRRVYSSLFFDHTEVELLGFTGDLQSFGAEIVFETNLLRRFPINWGIRYSNKIDRDQVTDFFLGTEVGF